MNSNKSRLEKRANLVKAIAGDLGFDLCGISRAAFLEEEAPRLEAWLNQHMHGKMAYMANHFDKRLDPTKLVEGARSVISLIYNYYPHRDINESSNFKIAKYAFGKDYHYIIKDKLKTFFQRMQEKIGEVNGRVFVDSAPVMERVWAQKSGIGWIGKNSLLLNRNMGSFFFLAEIIIDMELAYDSPIKDYCGTCTRCIDACPTGAIPEPYVVDGSRCISYFTIELKDQIPAAFKGSYDEWIFGCDICQDVCPWNRFSSPHREEKFLPTKDLERMKPNDWLEITQDVFNKVFRGSAVKRTKYEGLKRNISFVSKKDHIPTGNNQNPPFKTSNNN